MMTILPQTNPIFIFDKYHFISHNKKEYNRYLLTCNNLNGDKIVTKSPKLPHTIYAMVIVTKNTQLRTKPNYSLKTKHLLKKS